MPDSWTIRHFSLSNPAGEGQSDVAALLRRVADAIDERSAVTVQDLVFHTDVTEYGRLPSLTVYFHHSDDGEPRQLRSVE